MYIVRDFCCGDCGHRFDSLETRGAEDEAKPCPACDGSAVRVPSAVMARTPLGSVVQRGRPDEAPPGCVSTEALADGMPYSEWRAQGRGRRMDEHRKALGIDRQVYV